MKRLSLLLAVVLLLFTACGGTGTKKVTIDLIVKGTNTDFWKSVNEGAQAAAVSNNVSVTMYGPPVEKESMEQAEYVRQSVARKPDAIILAAADYTVLAVDVNRAVDAGIPVVMVDSDVDSERTVAFVGTDNRELGSRLARELCVRVTEKGNVALVSFVKESYPAVERETGFRDVIESDGRFHLLETQYCSSDIDLAKQQMTQILRDTPDLAAVAALNAQAATGAARALREENRRVPLFAVDCTVEEAMFMDEGVLDLALLQNPYQMGYYSVQTACGYLAGNEVADVYTDIYAVDKGNLFEEMFQQLIFPFQ